VLAFYRGQGSAGEGWPGWLTSALMALMPLKTGLMRGHGVRLRRGIKARGNCLAGHHEVRGRAARGGRRGRRKATGVSRCGGEDTSDKRGPVVRETRERRPAREGMNRKGKRIFCEDATDARAGWAGRDDFGPRGRCGWWAGWARGGTGRKVGRAESKEK
jgi:hypothetical protein